MTAEPLLLSNARVLDVEAGRYHDGRFVSIADGHVAAINDTKPRDAGREIDLGGRVLMPGLCDAHVHATAVTADLAAVNRMSPFYVAQGARVILEEMLQRGFTTVRDAGGADFGLAKAVEEGLIRGPRLLFCGHSLSPTGGHGDIRGPGQLHFNECLCCAGLSAICDGVAEIRRASREEIRRGAKPDQADGVGRRRLAHRPHRQPAIFLGGAAGGGRRSAMRQYSDHGARVHGSRHQAR
jgi:imidazolonepropionase-like amidohydrolase